MQSVLLKAKTQTIVSSAARTATGNSGALELPLADCYAFILDTAAGTGTSPTMDVAVQVTVDDGTTWYTAYRFAQATTAAAIRRLNVQGMLGRGEAGTEAAIAATGGALNANTVLTRKYRILWTIGGTNPSFTFAVHLISQPRQGAGY